MYLLASCPLGPATANGVGLLTEIYAIYMEKYTSHRAIARCFGLGLFADLALCQPHWHPANTPNCSTDSLLSSYNMTSDAHWSQLTPWLTSMTKIGPEKAHFRGYLTLTFDLWPWVTKNQSFTTETYLGAKYGGPRSNSSTFLRLWMRHTFLGNIYGLACC